MCLIKLVVFDLDNVIIDGEGIDEIGKLVNVEDQIAAITEQAMQGELNFETSIKQRVGLLEGAAVDDIKKLADEMPLMAGAEETVKSLKENGFDVIIISGSFDIIANTIKQKLPVDEIFTNSLVSKDGVLTGEVTGPLVSGNKLDVLKEYIADAGYTLDECISVGDGANDISMIESAKYGIAFNAKPTLKENADIIVETRNLTDVLDVILNLNSKNTDEGASVENEVAVETEVVETTDVVVENQDEQVTDVTEDAVEETMEDVEEAEEVVEEEAAEEEAEEAEEVVEEEAAEEEAEEAEEVVEEEAAEEEKPKKAKKSKKNKNSLPEPVDFVLADTPEGVRAQKDEKEELIAQIADERESFNREAKEQRKIRDELNVELKENLAKAIEFRDQRNEINKEVEENKKARNQVNEQIKNLEWSSGKRDKIKLENEIKKIDKIIETRVLDIKKENQLVKSANDLRKQLSDIKEDDKVKEEAQELKKQSEEYHAKVVELSEKAQEAHEQMLDYFRKTDEIRTAADAAHKKFIQARKAPMLKVAVKRKKKQKLSLINSKTVRNYLLKSYYSYKSMILTN